MTDEVFEQNLRHFKVVSRHGSKAKCVCPAHADKEASLSIEKGQKCTLFYCHAGCSTDDVLRAAGLDLKATFYEEREYTKKAWQTYVEKREQRKIEAVYNYVSSCDGSYCFTKLRLTGKKLLYGILKNDRFSYGLPRNTPRKSMCAIYGDVQAITEAISEGDVVFIP